MQGGLVALWGAWGAGREGRGLLLQPQTKKMWAAALLTSKEEPVVVQIVTAFSLDPPLNITSIL